MKLLVGNCIDVLRRGAADRVDAIVTDPPYGLEFMGKEWDRPWVRADGVGGLEGFGAVEMPDGAARLPRPSYTGSMNPTCRNCGGLRRGTDSKRGQRPCRCGTPEFPNVAAIRGRAFQAWCESWAVEAYRVLKPGGHLLAFGGTRTYHRLTCALEDAGFEIRDCLAWLYGTGFPKSLDVSKAIDKAAGAEREVVGTGKRSQIRETGLEDRPWMEEARASVGGKGMAEFNRTAPATPDAVRWQGWGTALKPAFEPIVLARKPLSERTVAANVQRWGTGALNVDGCRIGTEPHDTGRDGETSADRRYADRGSTNIAATPGPRGGAVEGRWPANVILDEEAAALLDEQSGERTTNPGTYRRSKASAHQDRTSYTVDPEAGSVTSLGDTGGASRFFYTAKASRKERNAGLENFEASPSAERHHFDGLPDKRMGHVQARNPAANDHPTVKPIALMRWLVRMVTPPGGLVVDPFVGSGTTGIAALLEGFDFVGIDQDPHYIDIARARIEHATLQEAS